MPSLPDYLDACNLVRQVNELKNSMLENVDRQLENTMFGLSGSRRNLSLNRSRIITNFVSVLNLRHLDVLVHLIVHFWDGSVVFVLSRSRTANEVCSPSGRISFLYFCPLDSRMNVSLVSCEGGGDVVGVVTPLVGGVAQAFHDDQVVELQGTARSAGGGREKKKTGKDRWK